LKSDEALWRDAFKKDVPKAPTRDLLVRTLGWHIRERAFGGHSPAIKLLASYAKSRPGDGQRVRWLKPGTELVRDYQGERHTVGRGDGLVTALCEALSSSDSPTCRPFPEMEDALFAVFAAFAGGVPCKGCSDK
jgi:hypothetical protein